MFVRDGGMAAEAEPAPEVRMCVPTVLLCISLCVHICLPVRYTEPHCEPRLPLQSAAIWMV